LFDADAAGRSSRGAQSIRSMVRMSPGFAGSLFWNWNSLHASRQSSGRAEVMEQRV